MFFLKIGIDYGKNIQVGLKKKGGGGGKLSLNLKKHPGI